MGSLDQRGMEQRTEKTWTEFCWRPNCDRLGVWDWLSNDGRFRCKNWHSSQSAAFGWRAVPPVITASNVSGESSIS